MKPQQAALTKSSEPEKVDAYIRGVTHPLAKIVESLRKIILSTDPEVGEEIKWNAPTFLYSGEMKSWEDWLAENGIAVEEKRMWELGGQSVTFAIRTAT